MSHAIQTDPTVARRDARGGVIGRLIRAYHANRRKIHPGLALANIGAALLPQDMFNHRRSALYRAAGLRIGRGAQIVGPLTLLGWDAMPGMLEIGEEAAIWTPCVISLAARVRIGKRVHFGPEVMVLTGTHKIGPPELRCGAFEAGPVEIGDGTWLGARVTVLPGVTIGPGCVVSAGAVVTRDMPANSVVAGNPARVVARLDSTSEPTEPQED